MSFWTKIRSQLVNMKDYKTVTTREDPVLNVRDKQFTLDDQQVSFGDRKALGQMALTTSGS